MRVLVADDHTLVRATLCDLLGREPDIETLEASSVEDALAVLDQAGRIDLVLLDYNMPGMDGLAGLALCRQAAAGAPVAILSGVAPPAVAREALEAGATGYLPKTVAPRAFVNAVRMMAAGERFVPVDILTDAIGRGAEAGRSSGRLTRREREVLEALLDGLTNKAIAARLGLQVPTVKLHLKTLCRKLDARNRTHAAMIARDAGDLDAL